MRTNYVANSGVRFNMLSQDQLQELFNAVLEVLQNTGLDVLHDEAREILAKAGAWVDGEQVRLPSYMVREALRKAPKLRSLL
jgi:trimethylamine--corrinoid protein Co-methyltransferase